MLLRRQSRSTDRYTERIKTLEERQTSSRDRPIHTPPALRGKFSAAFSQFEAQSARARSCSPSTQSSKELRRAATEVREPVKHATVEAVHTKPTESKPRSSSEAKTRSALVREDGVSKPSSTSTTNEKSEERLTPRKHVEKTHSLEVAVPGKATGSKVLERMAKFGQSVDVGSSALSPAREPRDQTTVTTRNQTTDKFERFTHSVKHEAASNNRSGAQPHFDVDIQTRKEDGKPAAAAHDEKVI